MPASSLSRFGLLDVARFGAACMIVLWHLKPWGPPWPYSYLAVDFFFMLSGFVLSHTHGFHLGAHLRQPLWPLVWQRFWRLFPLAAVGSLMALYVGNQGLWPHAVDLCHGDCLHSRVLWQHLTLTQAIGFAPFTLELNFPDWSISAEWWVFVLVCLTGIFRGGLPTMALVAVLTYAGLTFGGHGLNFNSEPLFVGSYGLWRCVAGFCTGVVVYGAYAWVLGLLSAPAVSSTVRFGFGVLMEMLVIEGIVYLYVFSPTWPDGLWMPLFAVGIFCLAFGWGPVAWLVRQGRLHLLGRLAFGMYVHHMWLNFWITPRMPDLLKYGLFSAFQAHPFSLYFAVLLLLAFVTYQLVEKPLMDGSHRWRPTWAWAFGR